MRMASCLLFALAGCVSAAGENAGATLSPKEFSADREIYRKDTVAVSGWIAGCGSDYDLLFRVDDGGTWCNLYSSRAAAELAGTGIEWPLPLRFSDLPPPSDASFITVTGRPVQTCSPGQVCVDYTGFLDVAEFVQ